MYWTEIREYLGSQEPFLILSRNLWSGENLRPSNIKQQGGELTLTYTFVSKTEYNDLSATWSTSYDRMYFSREVRNKMVYNGTLPMDSAFLTEDEWMEDVLRLLQSSVYSLKRPEEELQIENITL